MTVPQDEVDFDWQDYAACLDTGGSVTNLFFIEGYGSHYRAARKFCAGCPVVIDCLIEGLEVSLGEAMWGCMSPNERKLVRRMEIKVGLKKAAEYIWEGHRGGSLPVPPKSIWEQWDA